MRPSIQKLAYSEAFHNFADALLAKFQNNENPSIQMPRSFVTATARDFGFTPLSPVLVRSLRELVDEKGYRLQFGLTSVIIRRKSVTNVDPANWPGLIENICKILDTRYMESSEKRIRMTPAQFRNVATIWPDANQEFNAQCVAAMAKIGYALTFRVNYIDVRSLLDVPKPGKKPRPTHNDEPGRIRVMNARAFLPIAMAGRRVGWRQGFSHALIINAKTAMIGETALTQAVLMIPDAVLDCNGAALTNIGLTNGDVLLVNEAALLQVKAGTLLCANSGRQHEPVINAVPLQKDSSDAH